VDRIIATFDAERDRDLMICERHGVAYQADMHHRIQYGNDYAAKFEAYDAAIVREVNNGRCQLVQRHMPLGSSLLDIGAGDGAFVLAARKAGFVAKGMEVIPALRLKLQKLGLYANSPRLFDAVTFWDSIEHLEDPDRFLAAVRRGALAFASIPVFAELKRIRESKHYRPGEHLYYWTADGFVSWMELRGFRLLETSTHEMDAGRESIGAFAFFRSNEGSHAPKGAH